WIAKIFKKRVCTTFVEDSFNGALCQCGNARDAHTSVALGDFFSTAMVNHWDSAQHSSEYPTDAFGEVQFAGASKRHSYQFLRLSWDSSADMVYTMMTTHWHLPAPNLVVSVVGGESRTKLKTWVREVLRQGLVKASQRAAWILTAGLREGVGRCVGEAVRDHATAASSDSVNRVVALGITSWGLVHNREQLVNPQGSFPAKYYVQNSSRDSSSLDNNYQAFLLVDDGSVGRKGGETSFRAKIEDYISHQRTSGSIDIPVLCMLISGETSMLENNIPWLVLAGSGGIADFPSAEGDSEAGPSVDLKEKVTERVKKYFSAEPETDKLVEQALSIYQNKGLITIYHGEQESPTDFDTVLLRALVGSKQRASVEDSPYNEELKLAVAWNRVDIAKSELFNGDIHWRDLEESMTDVLVNDKPQFVRLFTENGLNILDYLTYGRLETLYGSVAEGTQLYQQVSGVLELLMGDVCQQFYYDILDLQEISSKRMALRVLVCFVNNQTFCILR
uniref:Transient receptor potential cation channel, subfamily M, member 4b, tandem duplicate 1 n=1 Tax=Kryptolebias marmoratus TaxID=37003 RepID=A0A3Q3AY31_KRYMA